MPLFADEQQKAVLAPTNLEWSNERKMTLLRLVTHSSLKNTPLATVFCCSGRNLPQQ